MSTLPALSYDDLLDAVPMRNAAVTSDRGPDDLVLSVPLKTRWFNSPPFTWLLPISRHRRVSLDALGAEVWQACDGRCRTLNIIRSFAKAHGLSFHEARVSVCQFLRLLVDRNLLVMIGADGAEVRW